MSQNNMTAESKAKNSGSHSCLVIAAVSIIAGILIIVIIAAIVIPAFVKYIKSSKASEAVLVMSELEHKVTQYYEDSGVDGACHFPPSADPVPKGQPCCEGVGPSDGEKWTAPAGTWEQEGWKAISFTPPESTYFAYQMNNTTDGDGAHTMELRAFSDFKPGGPRHTYSITIEGKQNDLGECIAKADAAVLSNEFE